MCINDHIPRHPRSHSPASFTSWTQGGNASFILLQCPPITTGYHTCPDGLLPTQRFPRLTMRLQMVSEMSNSAPNWLVSLLKRKQKTSPPQSHVAQETKHEKGNWGQVVWRTAFETYVPHNRMLLPDRLKSGLTHCRLVWKKSAYYYYTVWNCIFSNYTICPFSKEKRISLCFLVVWSVV